MRRSLEIAADEEHLGDDAAMNVPNTSEVEGDAARTASEQLQTVEQPLNSLEHKPTSRTKPRQPKPAFNVRTAWKGGGVSQSAPAERGFSATQRSWS